MAHLFGRTALEERARTVQTKDILPFVDIVKTWLHDYDHGSLKTATEQSMEQPYNSDFFVKILGYTQKPVTPYTFEVKQTLSVNEEIKFPDATLRYTDPSADIDNIAAVVELKAVPVSLDRPQKGQYKDSPVRQAFGYKTKHRRCPFVVVSNFFEFRLYNDNELDFESWTLRDLVDPADDYLKFKSWYVLLRAESMTTPHGISETEALLTKVRQEQEEIGKQFYADYHEARMALLADVWTKNPGLRNDFEAAVKDVQTIIDRIVFVCFAEDTGLLPDATLAGVLATAQTSSYSGVWDEFKSFFRRLDEGSEKLGIPDGFSGGLFTESASINSLKISDKALTKLAELGNYDFKDALSVTILGQIFEQSITDLEKIKQEVRGPSPTPPAQLPSNNGRGHGRRKKEGIHYTKDYIADLIVRRTLGVYLKRKEEELKLKFKLDKIQGTHEFDAAEQRAYQAYQQVLQNVTVLDPACGSGVFLISALRYLREENKRVHEILAFGEKGGSLLGDDALVRDILTKNLFGVDLNDESVEITKLSLWLETASKNKPLTDLNARIKVGNSLIASKSVDPAKAFDWKKAFPEVAQAGGFDVIVGNPPYVRVQLLDTAHTDHFMEMYSVPYGKIDLSILFFERALGLLQPNGIAAFISSSQWMQADYGRKLRALFETSGQLIEVIDFGSLPVFEGATTYAAIFVMDNHAAAQMKKVKKSIEYARIDGVDQLNTASVIAASRKTVEVYQKAKVGWAFGDFDLIRHLKKMKVRYQPLSAVGHGYVGDITGDVDSFIVSSEWVKSEGIESGVLHPYISQANDVHRWEDVTSDNQVIYPYVSGANGEPELLGDEEFKSKYPHAYQWLEKSKAKLENRRDTRKLYATGDGWFRHLRPGSFNYFDPVKLVAKGLDKQMTVGVLEAGAIFNGANTPGILIEDSKLSIDYLLGVLNSRVMSFHAKNVCPPKQSGTFRINLEALNRFPIVGKSDSTVEGHVRQIRADVAALGAASDKFKKLVCAEYSITWPPRLVAWWELDAPELIKKIKVKIPLKAKAEFIEYWEGEAEVCRALAAKIETTERALDDRVFDLYRVSPADRATINAWFDA